MITYEVSDEAFCFKMLFDPNMSLLEDSTEVVYADLQKNDLMNLAKLDVTYCIFKKSSFQSIEHIYKHVKFLS
jgi:hypothetical protein